MQEIVSALQTLRLKPEIQRKGGDRVIRDACAVLNNRHGSLLLAFQLDLLTEIAELHREDREVLDEASQTLKRRAIGN